MKFGTASKAFAGLGQSMGLIGQMGFAAKLQSDLDAQRQEVLAKRDEVIQRYENQRQGAQIAAHKEEGVLNRATQEKMGMMSKAAQLEGIQLQLSAKDNRPTIIPKGSVAIAPDGTELYSNTAAEDKTINVPEGTVVLDAKTRKPVFRNPKDPKAEGLPKLDRDTDARINDLRSTITARMGTGFMEMLDPTERKEYDQLFTKAAKMIRKGSNMEDAFSSVVDELDRIKSRVSTPGAGNPAIEGFRKRFGY